MDPRQWSKIKPILERAIMLGADERSAYLSEACGQNTELHREVESLLAYEAPAEDKLEEPAFSGMLDAIKRSVAGREIGNYKLIEELASGGMGTVYLAERSDGEFEQKVALKLIKRGMDSDAIIRRFVHERQILASLEHPNIARLIDGGTTSDGLPYFVMEFVEAETIIDYANRKQLDLDERLKLFRKVCSAVSFAHQNLVVHRDLKPSNILVTDEGVPKLLDFGIAKLLKSETNDLITATNNYAFTPEYASPEQVRVEKLTTATDIYSLGVILYELLSGRRPYTTSGKSIDQVIKAVCETVPVRPSTVVKTAPAAGSSDHPTYVSPPGVKPQALRGDLDNIILKAIRKEPERRYLTVEQLSEDIRRHLAGLPVTATRDTWRYRGSKFVRRNRIGVTAAVFIFISLIGGLVATLYQRNKAQRRFNDMRQLANSFMFEINEQIVKSPIKARELLVQRASEYLDKLAAESGSDLELQAELATAYEKIGDIQGEMFNPNLGNTSEALNSHQKALALRVQLFAADPTTARKVEIARSHIRIGDILGMGARIGETRDRYRRAIDLLQPILGSEPKNVAARRSLASAYARVGQAILRSGSLAEALENYDKALALFEQLHAEDPDDIGFQRSVGIVYSYIGFVRYETKQTDEAVACYGKWLEIEQKINALDPANIGSLPHLSTAQTWYGMMLDEQGRRDEAVFHLSEGVNIGQKLFEVDEDNFGSRISLADANLELGKVLAKYRRTDEAIDQFQNAIGHYNIIWEKDNQSGWTKRRIAFTERHLAGALLEKGQAEKALEIYLQSLDTFKALTASDPEYAEWQLDLAMGYLRLGEFYLKRQNETAALEHFKLSQPIFDKLYSESPQNVNRKLDLETANAYIARLTN